MVDYETDTEIKGDEDDDMIPGEPEEEEEEEEEKEDSDEEMDVMPETGTHSFFEDRVVDEPRNLTSVRLVVPDEERRTSHMMSIAEFTEAISLRTEQINATGMSGCMLTREEIPPHVETARDLALAEMRAKKCPLKLIRVIGTTIGADSKPRTVVEIWKVNSMMQPQSR